ncbi:transcription initiation factor TFIID subunit [Heterostelium album PN500]|uniref:Transcription initiation factor TFIID subunit n=1 Tax=Heterostelium pallidum (strain ATCC 26659 / Pp 5 / PN500) TaxID=670386 RepID=D3BFF9_HETP5|nr:transcription initiation factor TFIID subunit [Heterostelium album PN500]EFA79873.1 transcription initiation factor TFIID subunit [Heterostelium album PN500]|eukprot:XP_020431994.1 transcription initiation factor TFIID subunit [Heterostelium album PN500]
MSDDVVMTDTSNDDDSKKTTTTTAASTENIEKESNNTTETEKDSSLSNETDKTKESNVDIDNNNNNKEDSQSVSKNDNSSNTTDTTTTQNEAEKRKRKRNIVLVIKRMKKIKKKEEKVEKEEKEVKDNENKEKDSKTTATTAATTTTDKDMMDIDSSSTTTTTTTTTSTSTASSSTAPKTPDNQISGDAMNTTADDHGGSGQGKILPKTLASLTQTIQDDQTPAYLVSNKEDIDITQTNLDEPRDARVIKNILKTMGVQAHDPRVVNQLLEFMFKYVYEVLQDSVAYSDHSGRSDIDISDIRLSIQSRVNFSFTQPPPREVCLFEEKNKIPLPPIPQKFGILLPPDDYCLTYPNYQVDPPKPPPPQPVQPLAPQTQRGHYNKKIPEKQIPIRLNVTQPPSIINPPINGKHQDK